MSLCRLLLLRSLRRPTSTFRTPQTRALSNHHQHPDPFLINHHRTFAFSSAEEAAAERRRRKRRLRIEPPLQALRRDYPPPPRDPNAPRLPDSTSALVGHRLSLHNRVQSLIRAFDLDAASAVARRSVFSNTRPTVFTCNAIIAAMYRNKRYTDAIDLFRFFFKQSNIVPNVVSYNNLINAHCDMGNVDVGLEVYKQILEEAPFSPSPVTYRHLTKGLIDVGRISEAVDLLREMLNKGHGADSMVYNNLIAGFLKMENLEKANELFDELKERCLVYDGVVNATFMDWFFNRGRGAEAMESYKSLLDRQFKMIPATCNVLLEVLLKHDKKVEAWALFHQMLDNHAPPNFQAVNSDTFNLMVNECFKLGNISEAFDTFKKAGTKQGSKPFAMDVAGYNNIIARYCENEMLSDAEKLFTELSSKSLTPDVTTYRTLIDAYLKMGRIDDALQVFNKMVGAGLRVVASFGNRVFDVLFENGKAVECAEILTKMGNNEIKPDVTCYENVVKGVLNAGALDSARDILEQMMRYNVGVAPALRAFVSESFGKAGRGEEVERMFNVSRYAANNRPSGPPRMAGQPWGQPSRPPQVAGQVPQLQNQQFEFPHTTGSVRAEPSRFPQMTGSTPPHMAGQMSPPPYDPSRMSGQFGVKPSGPPQKAGQVPHNMVGQMAPPPYDPSRVAGKFGVNPSGPAQMTGQMHPPAYDSPRMVGHIGGQTSGYSQMTRSVPSNVSGQVSTPPSEFPIWQNRQ